MYCPEVIIISTRRIYLVRNGRCDYKSRKAPLLERTNIFRYELIVRGSKTGHLLRINKDGRAWIKISSAIWRVKQVFCRHTWVETYAGKMCLKCLKRKD